MRSAGQRGQSSWRWAKTAEFIQIITGHMLGASLSSPPPPPLPPLPGGVLLTPFCLVEPCDLRGLFCLREGYGFLLDIPYLHPELVKSYF